MFWFLQNSRARSCFKKSLMQSTLAYIKLWKLKIQREKITSLIQFHISRYNEDQKDILKCLKEKNVFYESKKEIATKHELYTKVKFKLRRKKKFKLCIFWIKEKLILWVSRSKTRSSSNQEVHRKIIFPWYLRNCHDILRTEKYDLSFLKRRKDDILLSIEHHFYWLLKSSCIQLLGNKKMRSFFSQNIDGKMIFTDYWKILGLNFTEMGNTVFFWAKKLMEKYNLLITEKLLWNFLMERLYLLITE